MAEYPGYGDCHADKQSPSLDMSMGNWPPLHRCNWLRPCPAHALHRPADRIDDRVMTLFGMKADVIAGSDRGVERRAPHRRILAKPG
jgi:hypothetical protein